MHNVLATNKVSSCLGTAVATAKYVKTGNYHRPTALTSALLSFVGSFAGSQIALMIDRDILKKGFTFILPFIAVFVLFKKNDSRGEVKLSGPALYIVAGIIGLVIGMYDGLIGPGTGTFLIFAYTTFVGFDYITAGGNAKIINLASNRAAAASYLWAGKVLWAIALPAAAANIAGNYLGSAYAIKHGAKVIRRMLILVLVGIFIKLVTDIF